MKVTMKGTEDNLSQSEEECYIIVLSLLYNCYIIPQKKKKCDILQL